VLAASICGASYMKLQGASRSFNESGYTKACVVF
jgi:hypothetical protein